MKLATFNTIRGVSYGAVTDKGIVDLGRSLDNRFPDLKALIAGNGFAEAARHLSAAADYQESDVTWLPVIPNPGKIVCVGLSYEEHRVETGRDKTEHPALFLRLTESQVGHKQPILRPRESQNFDYEAEIAVIIEESLSTMPGITSPAIAATTTARCATGSATPSSGPQARTSPRPAASARGWSPPTRSRPGR